MFPFMRDDGVRLVSSTPLPPLLPPWLEEKKATVVDLLTYGDKKVEWQWITGARPTGRAGRGAGGRRDVCLRVHR